MKGKSESEVAQSCPTLRDPMVCSLPGSSVHGIFQARVLEWGAIAFSIALTNPLPFNQDVVDTVWEEPHEHSSGLCGQGPVRDAWLRPDCSLRVSLKVEPPGSNKALCRASGLGGGLSS